ncbi:hypothetical protein ACFV98_35560 [Streptomyces violascens]|uniref:hypothetical protein n=1 Tax=Streptomyces violascens TaxID=67381 RepID=UPI00364E67F9
MHITAPRPVALAMTAVCTAALLTLSACNDPSPEPPDPSTSDAVTPSPPAPEWTDPIPAGPGDTNPCAFSGDLLCPIAPITIPAPDLRPWS